MRRSFARWLPIVPVAAGAAVVGIALTDDDEPEPVAITSSAPSFTSLGDVVAASDLVVVATVADASEGRAITAPDDPQSGVRTRLLTLDVSAVLVGDATGDVLVEEPAELADGTPVIVDGVAPLDVGDEAIWFLVAGDAETMPYFAVVNNQGRYTVDAGSLEPATDEPLSRRLAELGREELVTQIVDPA